MFFFFLPASVAERSPELDVWHWVFYFIMMDVLVKCNGRGEIAEQKFGAKCLALKEPAFQPA